jgi:hypothetical protein
MNKSILTNFGGQGCIFNPSIPCKNEKRTKKKSKKGKKGKKGKKQEISKIVFRDESAKREFKMNELVRKIPNNSLWAVLWDKHCKTPSYHKLKKISEFDKCITQKNEKNERKKKKVSSKKKQYTMLKGPFGGAISYYAFIDMCDASTFSTMHLFANFFLQVFSYMESLFIGLVELQKAEICHQDINYRNILFEKKQMFFIDFGLTCVFSNKKEIMKRLHIAFSNDRIYDAFSYDYTLVHATMNKDSLKALEVEKRDFENGLYRVHHEDYVSVQEDILKRENENELIYEHMCDIIDGSYKENAKTIIQGLDIYSLGILLPMTLYDIAISKNISKEQLSFVCESPKIQEHLQLFRDMTQFHARDRISATAALDRYRYLQSKNKSKSKKKSSKKNKFD